MKIHSEVYVVYNGCNMLNTYYWRIVVNNGWLFIGNVYNNGYNSGQ